MVTNTADLYELFWAVVTKWMRQVSVTLAIVPLASSLYSAPFCPIMLRTRKASRATTHKPLSCSELHPKLKSIKQMTGWWHIMMPIIIYYCKWVNMHVWGKTGYVLICDSHLIVANYLPSPPLTGYSLCHMSFIIFIRISTSVIALQLNLILQGS